MLNKTSVEYGERSWQPVSGCSYGCSFCWAEAMFNRFPAIRKAHGAPSFSTPMCHPERLDEPLRQKRPARVLVSFMGDLFGPEVPDVFRGKVLDATAEAPHHEFFMLTKRAREMADFFGFARVLWANSPMRPEWPFPRRLWAGVSVSCRRDLGRVEEIVQVRMHPRAWISAEPLLGDLGVVDLRGIGFVVVGSIDRPSPQWPTPRREWIENIREQCQAAGVPLWEKNNLRTRGPVRDRKLIQELPT